MLSWDYDAPEAVAAVNGSVGNTSAVVVNSGGTLLLGGSDVINNSAPVTLAGHATAR